MARSVFADPLQVYPFWLMDLAPTDATNLPIFTPLFGFSSISAPEVRVETMDINEGNFFFGKKVIKRASVSDMTLTRGVTFYDSDFWRWILSAITGDTSGFKLPFPLSYLPVGLGGPTYRRTMLLIHYFSKLTYGESTAGRLIGAAINASLAVTAAGISDQASGVGLGVAAAETFALGAFEMTLGLGPFTFAPRIPAKAYMLQGCIPTRWKSGGDFDAMSGAVSVAELDMSVEIVEEISLSA